MKISYSQINNECNELHSLAMNITENVSNLKILNSSLMNNHIWIGKSSENYIKKMESLLKNFDELCVEIENSILYLAKCSEGYQVIDQEIMNQICNHLNIKEPNLETSKFFN